MFHVVFCILLFVIYMFITSVGKKANFTGTQRKMISMDNFFVFLRLLFFALLLLFVT